MKGKIWLYLVFSVVCFIFLGFNYFLFFNIKYGFTLPSITIGLPLLVGMFFLAFDSVQMVRSKDEKRGQRGYIIGYLAVMVSTILLPHMGSFILSHPARIPLMYTQTDESLVLGQVIKEYSGFYNKVTGYTIIYPEFSDSYRNLTESQLKEKKNRIVAHIIDANKRGEIPGVFDDAAISSLVDNFFFLNLSVTSFAIKSAPQDKYYIDYDYVAKFPGGWGYEHKLKNFFRITIDKTSVKVSRPYWDKSTGIVLADINNSVYIFYYHDDRAEMVDAILDYGFSW